LALVRAILMSKNKGIIVEQKYIAKWGFVDFKTVGLDFFSHSDKYKEHMSFKKGSKYTEQDIFMIEKLRQGDCLDLSDGFQSHSITRIK
jgi:hypothetical protein